VAAAAVPVQPDRAEMEALALTVQSQAHLLDTQVVVQPTQLQALVAQQKAAAGLLQGWRLQQPQIGVEADTVMYRSQRATAAPASSS
jgi:hypothetical protein